MCTTNIFWCLAYTISSLWTQKWWHLTITIVLMAILRILYCNESKKMLPSLRYTSWIGILFKGLCQSSTPSWKYDFVAHLWLGIVTNIRPAGESKRSVFSCVITTYFYQERQTIKSAFSWCDPKYYELYIVVCFKL